MSEAGARACAFMQQLVTGLEETGCAVVNNSRNTARLPVIVKSRGYWKALLLVMMLMPVSAFALTPPGTSINNTASAAFDVGGTPDTVSSNTITVVSTIIGTPSTITLYQYDAVGPGAISEEVPTQHATSGPPGGGFVVSPDPVVPGIGVAPTTLDPNTPIALNPVISYHTGEPVFIELIDLDQNLNPAIQETIVVTVTSSLGDQEELILTETDVNTGTFIGYVQSTGAAVTQYDGVITLGADATVDVNYVDQYDGSDTSAASTLVDPFGRVFDSNIGTDLDGIIVEILDAAGSPANVYGDDGISTYPNVVTTGGSVTDSSGTVYNFPTGGYRFPLLAPGNYQLVVTVPPSLTAPSQRTIAELQALPTAPYALDIDASFGNVFVLQAGPPLHVDIPVDPLDSVLLLEKTASKDNAAIGDFVQYALRLENVDSVAISTNTEITDKLPLGFRYQSGSVRVNGSRVADPTISSDGRTLQLNVGTLDPGDVIDVTYVTEIGSSVRLGRAVNTAFAVDLNLPAVRSNDALASIEITEELFSSHSFIIGRVINGDCSANPHELPGFENARIYMEDGTYVVTDENGLYHIEGVTPGAHVVQLDKESIPDDLEIVACEENTRFAGTPYSQFVDIKGGSMWRADFYVRQKEAIKDELKLSLQSELHNEEVKYKVDMTVGEVPVSNYRLMIVLPDGVDYIPGSSTNGAKIDDPEINGNILVYRLGDVGSEWNKQLKLRAHLKDEADGMLVSKAMFTVDTVSKRSIRSSAVVNELEVRREKVDVQEKIFNALFRPMSVELTPLSKLKLRKTIESMDREDVKLNLVVGHTDGQIVKNRSKWMYKNNSALSLARAKAVSDFLINDLGIDADTVELDGKSDLVPVASNETVEGRASNRRADLYITTTEIVDPGSVDIVKPIENTSVEVEGQPEYEINKVFDPFDRPEKVDISHFDEYWIKDAEPGTEWLMPAVNQLPEIPAVNIAVKYNPANNYQLLLNGEPVNPLFDFGSIRNKQQTVARVYWQGVHIKVGSNKFEFIETNKQGKHVARLSREIIFSDVPVRAELVEEYSWLTADGTHTPVIALRFYDKEGNIAHPGLSGEFKVNQPYISKTQLDAFEEDRVSVVRERRKPKYKIGPEGVALIELEPTSVTGKVIIDLHLSGIEEKRVEAWLKPEMRDWILVGLADGTFGDSDFSGNIEGLNGAGFEEDFYDDERIAFFAKGRIKGEWLLTTSYDSDKGENERKSRVNQIIDPDTYYTIYGDNTEQRYDASSSEKLYVKIEREQFYALYGDFDTGMDVTELSKYNRRMTGARSEYEGDKYSFNVFAAENLNNFIKDEIRGDGTSGLYRLSGNDIVINGESIVIETRDRFRSEIIIETKTLRRHLDYNIDYQDGTIYFREPIPSKDGNFNPVYIVADYEVESPVEGDITAGGRAAVKLMDDKLELGASVIHDATFGAEGDLIGVDATLDISKETKLKVEVSDTDGETGGTDVSGSAFLAEVEHQAEDMDGRVYFRQQDDEFGLGQQSGGQNGTRKYGAEGRYRVSDEVIVDGLAYHEDNLNTDATRDVTEANVTYTKDNYLLSAGGRMARDADGAGQDNDSDLLLLGASTRLYENKLNVRVNSETALNSADENLDNPSRYIVGADYQLTSTIELFAENEWTYGSSQDTEMTRGGARATPWDGAFVDTSVNREALENGERMFATLGMTQAFKISEKWSGDVALDRTKTIREPGPAPLNPINPDVPLAQGTTNDDFTAVSAGVAYHGDSFTLTNRLETRNAASEHKAGLIVGWERNLVDGIGYAVGTTMFDTDRVDGSSAFEGHVKFSMGYRPLSSHWVTLNRLEYKFDEEISLLGRKDRQRKLINNFVTNYKPDYENQLSINYGVKYVIDSFDGDEYDGTTHLLGSEYRHDITEVIDFGIHGNTMYSANSNNFKYSSGVSVGFNLARNIWLSVGYNYDGFEDRDFSTASYTAQGPYVQFRMKFDQDTAGEIAEWLK
jgi:uncharacterized repeat protein (TIGR01451 family)